jgi:peptide-methionine (S)-S-oxide reductase
MKTTQLSRWYALLLLFCLSFNAGAATPTATATFAGGCFWCMEPPFDNLDGVISTTSGYLGGTHKNPTYKLVSLGGTGHAEVVQVIYDPEKVSYAKLLDTFWQNIDPTRIDGQFCDYGNQYRSEIFYHDADQKQLAEQSRVALVELKPFEEPVLTKITLASKFFPAEDYHQDYYIKNPVRYKFYRYGCGRDSRLQELWGNNPESH